MPNTPSNSRAFNNAYYTNEASYRFDGGGWHYSTISTPASGMPTSREANAVANATVKPRVTFALICKPSKGEHIAAGGELERHSCSREPVAGGEIGKTGKCEIVRSGGLQDSIGRAGCHAPSNDSKSENSGKHRDVSRTKTGNGSREAADESRMSGESPERGMTAFSAITANLARTEADEVRFYFTDFPARVRRDGRNNTNRAKAHGWMLTIERRGATAAVTRTSFSTETTKGDKQMKTKLDTMNHRQRAAFARSLYHRHSLRRTAITAASAYGIRRAK